jgi:ankyrin repeat protein
MTALMRASRTGQIDSVVELLKHDKIDVNHQNHGGMTALMWAIKGGQIQIVVEFLKHDKVDVNLRDRFGETAFFLKRTFGSTRNHS